jgi:hypothetical protein
MVRGSDRRGGSGARADLPALLLLSVILLATVLIGCSDRPGTGTGAPTPATTEIGGTTTPTGALSRLAPGGEVVGLVPNVPLTLDEVRGLGGDLGGDVIAVFRTDYTCIRPLTFGAPEWEPEPSRFAYMDAGGIRERRMAAVDAGLSPPITGWHIAESYWLHWEDQWARAQDPGVEFEALAIYLPAGSATTLSDDPRFAAVTVLPSRRTDSLSPDFSGELLLETEEFTGGSLSSPPIPDCAS